MNRFLIFVNMENSEITRKNFEETQLHNKYFDKSDIVLGCKIHVPSAVHHYQKSQRQVLVGNFNDARKGAGIKRRKRTKGVST